MKGMVAGQGTHAVSISESLKANNTVRVQILFIVNVL
jgi:hypothetical protein